MGHVLAWIFLAVLGVLYVKNLNKELEEEKQEYLKEFKEYSRLYSKENPTLDEKRRMRRFMLTYWPNEVDK